MPQDSTAILDDSMRAVVDALIDSINGAADNGFQQQSLQTPVTTATDEDNDRSIFTPLIIIGCMALVIYKLNNWLQPKIERISRQYFDEPDETPAVTAPDAHELIYNGNALDFSDDEMVKVLNKYFPYYPRLGYHDKLRFFERMQKFMSEKIFVIHDASGFKEMPILISAAAVQISFGLEKYLLPNFSHIHIFPDAFIGVHPTLRLLEGNVSGHTINLSWKHFLDGYKFPDNGQNVGLHEFAHAYYYQYFETGENVEQDFVASFPRFDSCGSRAFEQEQLPGNDLYSDYALTNFQEFWAESVEVFFERPANMKAIYPELYAAMCEVLNQDPANNVSHFA